MERAGAAGNRELAIRFCNRAGFLNLLYEMMWREENLRLWRASQKGV